MPLSLFSRLLNVAAQFKLLPIKELRFIVKDLKGRPKTLLDHYNSTYNNVVAPTSFLAKAYQANGLRVPIKTHWFGVDISRICKPTRAVGSPLRFGYIGQLAEHKGVDLLLEAFQHLPPCEAEVIIYGPINQDLAYSKRLQQLANSRVHMRATFLLKRWTCHERSRCFGDSSRWYENSPLVLLYALATHTPVIVSRVDGLTEFLEEGVNGYSFERGSWTDLLRVLQRFISDPTLAAKLSSSTNYERTTSDMAIDLEKLYLETVRTSN